MIDEYFEKNNKGGKEYETLKSDRNYITRFIYRNLGENEGLITSDLIINIIAKAFETISSFYALKEAGIKCNMAKYLGKHDTFILPFYERSKKIINNKIRLSLGKYVARNYIKITNDSNIILVNPDEKDDPNKKRINKTDYKKYIDKSLLKDIPFMKTKNKRKRMNKSTNYILNDKYIEKTNEHFIDGYYNYIPLPQKIKNEKIQLIEIIPINNGESFDIHYKYQITIKDDQQLNEEEIDNYVSIDLGVVNLMTIYDPSGEQIIINGKHVLKINHDYNYKIDKLKSKLKKKNNKHISKKITALLKRRNHKINNYFNLIVKLLIKKYPKKIFVIGYNTNWKNKVKMGKKNNRTFYEIPYCMLLNKLKFQLKCNGQTVEINEESYTSKCDALAFEDIKKQKSYQGKRITRGLFKSSTGQLLNADLNGAINILRKYLLRKLNKKLTLIKGCNIFNPIRINVFCDVCK